MTSCRALALFIALALVVPLSVLYGGIFAESVIDYASRDRVSGGSHLHRWSGGAEARGFRRGDRAVPGSRNLLFYDLAECNSCKSSDEVRDQSCIDFQREMRERIAATTGGALVPNSHQWNLLWICRPYSKLSTGFASRVGLEEGRFHATLEPGRLVNYVPPARTIVSPKRSLCAAVRDMWGKEMWAFFPPCFLLPEEREDFMEYQSGLQREGADLAFVTKDDMGTGGFSIRVFPRALGPEDIARATYVQQYIFPPLLAAGRKFDCRIFALVPSFDPFRVYVGTEGYIRRTLLDDDGDLNNPITQITNNMYAKQYARETDETLLRYVRAPLGSEERGLNSTKWSMRALLEYASEKLHRPQASIWAQMREAIARTLASVAPSLSCTEGRVPYPCGSAFHVFGVDVVFRGDGTPFVLEANTQSDYLSQGTILHQVHAAVVGDTVAMLGLNANLPSHVDVNELRQAVEPLLEAEEKEKEQELGSTDWRTLARMLREYCLRGSFDLAFPHPAARWDEVAERLGRRDFSRVYRAFTAMLDRGANVCRLVRHWTAPFAEGGERAETEGRMPQYPPSMEGYPPMPPTPSHLPPSE